MARFFPLVVLALIATAGAPYAQSGIRLEQSGIAGASATDVASPSYRLGATLGQPIAGASSSASYALGAGFWYGPALSAADGGLGLDASVVVAAAGAVCSDVTDASTCDFSGVTGTTAEVPVGDRAAVLFTFTNTSTDPNPAFLDIGLSDPNLGDLGVVAAAAAGASDTYAATFVVASTGGFTATATGEDADGYTVSATAAYTLTAPGSGVPLAVVPPGGPVGTGGPFDVEVVVGTDAAPVADLFGVGFELSFDPAVLELVAATPGAFLDDGDLTVFPGEMLSPGDLEAANASGQIAYTVTRTDGTTTGDESGTGPVAVFTFTAVQATGDTPTAIGLANVQANDPSGVQIDLDPVGATLVVQDLVVWPGDTDDNGAVEAADLLPVGAHYGLTGPARGLGYDTWAGQPAVPWTPPAATYADADGDGDVDQNDVLPIGVHFGKTAGSTQSLVADGPKAAARSSEVGHPGAAALRAGPLAVLPVPRQPVGSQFDLTLSVGTADEPLADLYGVAATFDLPAGITVADVTPGAWLDDGDLLSFSRVTPGEDGAPGELQAAVTRKAPAPPAAGHGSVLAVRFEVAAEMRAAAEIALTALTAAASTGGAVEVGPDAVVLDGGVAVAAEDEGVLAFGLDTPRPNPARTSARLVYTLPTPSEVRLRVFDQLGREVIALEDGERSAGRHEATLDLASVAAGVYVVRVEAGPDVASRLLTVVR